MRLCVWLIQAYRASLSPMLGARCRFTPTCSEYAEQAMRERGLVRGLGLGLWRLLRCQPLCRGGHDPLPVAPSARAKASAAS